MNNDSSEYDHGSDKEKGLMIEGTSPATNVEEYQPEKVVPERFGKFGNFLDRIFSMGVEARGIERVPDDERESKHALNNLFMWFSVNTVLTTLPIGVLAQEFFTLSLPHAIAVIFCFCALGAACSSFIATLGPLTGMRTMVISRYSSGMIGCSIFSFFNVLTQMGFSCTCVILGGQTLASINPGTLPLTVGIIIISILTLVICFFGYNFLHHYERWAWILLTIIFICLYALGGAAGYDINAQKELEDKGRDLTADILSFGGIVFGSTIGWGPVCADYNCKLPAKTSSLYVFTLTFFGLLIPISFAEILGATLMTIQNPAYVSAFEDGGTGGLLAQVLARWHGFGKFILVLLALSVVANNVPNTYSAALSVQAFHRWLAYVPRAVWTVVVTVAYTIAAVAGREHFATILSNLLSILSYWCAFFFVILFLEHFLFRRPGGMLGGYDLDAYNDPKKLPIGIAAIVAGTAGVVGAVLGMDQTYYNSVISRKLGPYGADIGFELAAAFCLVVYPPLRYLEIKHFGR